MKSPVFITLTLALLTLASPAREPNTLTEEETKDGWQLLFDGKSAEHWRNYKKEDISEKWVIEDGALTLTGKGGGNIITREQFESYELVLEFKISEGGNSGLMFGVTETDKPPYATGPEVQIIDNAKGKDPQKTGWLYQLYKPETDTAKPAGEWNEIRLKLVKGAASTVWVNGQKYYDFIQGSDDWNERVSKSKFTKWPEFGTFTKGHICLQDHGNRVSFRNIRIRKL